MKFLLLLMGVAATTAAVATPKAWPCPLDTDIYPCTCTIGDTIEPNMDCSAVTNNDVLAAVFQTDFPYTAFNNLTIQPTAAHPDFFAIESFVFGEVSFRHVVITNTYIRIVEEEAFTPSHDSLISLDMSNNRIDTFPIETLPLFVHLRILNLAGNKLPTLPNVESSSLLSFDLSENVGLTVTSATFVGLEKLEELYLRNMGFTSLPPNVFSSLTYFKILDLSSNGIAGLLGMDVISVPLDSLEDLRLNNNALTQIHSSAITGMDKTGTVDFRDNDLTTLDWDNWFPLVDGLTGLHAVDLEGNQLACGCDVLWLLLDPDNLDKIKDSATCGNGTPLKETDVAPLLILC